MTDSKLSTKQRKALAVLATSGGVTEAAEAAGVTRETVYSWLHNNPEFSKTLENVAEDAISELSTRLLRQGKLALDTVEQILTNPNSSETAKLKAVDIIIKRLIQLHDLTIVQRRLTELEEFADV